ncbi:MAG TPA: type II toxin-antitoxin system RelE/ParE family toxin [Tepidisphaeraceae bacterium]|jgi:hypothetical protein
MWNAATTGEFDRWFESLHEDVRVEVAAAIEVLQRVGPTLGRPLVDQLKGSKHANLKELRIRKQGMVVRIAFAFDPQQTAILLVAGDKAGVNQRRFYKQLIRRADKLLDAHLEALSKKRK